MSDSPAAYSVILGESEQFFLLDNLRFLCGLKNMFFQMCQFG